MEKKYCYKCNKSLPIDSFGKNGYRKDGYDNVCRNCRRKKYLRENRSARRYFPDEITDEEIITEAKRRGIILVRSKE